jgi:hypothetical protein
MSLIKANAVQVGQSNTATQNFTLAVPSSPDGTIKLARGNAGATTQDVLNVSNAGVVSFPQGLGNISNSTAIATGSTTARSLANRFSDVVNVKDFGAVGDGVADDTAALQAAFNNTNFVNAYIMSPAGYNYRVTNTLVLDRDRFTLDFNKSGITMDDPTGLKDTIKVGNGTTQRNGIVIKNITFGRIQTATAGYVLNLDRTGVIYVQECRIFGDNKVHGGIRVFNGIMVHIENNMIDRCINYGIYLEGADTIDRTIDVVIRENRVDYCYNGLQIWDCVEGVYFRDNIFFGNTNNAVNVDASTVARGLVSFKFQENDFDGSGQTGFYIDKVSNVQITDNWFSSNLNTGIAANLHIGSNAFALIVDANQLYCAPGPYISLRSDGSDVIISSNLLNGGTTGMLIMGTLYSITGNSLKYLTTGINLFSANKYTVTGNDFESVTSPMGISGGASEIVVANNGGYCVATTIFDPPNIPAGGDAITTVSVNGAVLGDIVNVSFKRHDFDLGVIIYGAVTATDTVTVRFYNTRSYSVDFPSSELNVSVTKAIQY